MKQKKYMDTTPGREVTQMNQLTSEIEDWAFVRQLHFQDPRSQFLKVVEEVGEIAAAMARQDADLAKDAIGDTFVTLVILAMQNGWTIDECVARAYEEIKNRKGKTQNGVFVKE